MDKKWYTVGLTLDSDFNVTYGYTTLANILYEEEDFFLTKINDHPYIENKNSKMFITDENTVVKGGYNICGVHYGTEDSAYEQAWTEFSEFINPKTREVIEVPKFNV